MKPTSLLIPALGLFASSAISAAISKRSNAAVPRTETLPEGVITFSDVSKRGNNHARGVITDVDGTIDGAITDADGAIDGAITDADSAIKGAITDADNAIDGAIGKRSKEHAEGVKN